MEIRLWGYFVLVGYWLHGTADAHEFDFKPLFAETAFNQLLSESMELWAELRCLTYQERGGCYDCVIDKLTNCYSMIVSLSYLDHVSIHPGNLEYLLTVFDKISQEFKHLDFIGVLIKQIRKKIVDLL